MTQLSCINREISTYDEMKSDDLLVESFTNNELKDLSKIVDFFESEICSYTKKSVVEECYIPFLKLDSVAVERGELLQVLNYDKQKDLYKSIDSAFFKDLWYTSEMTRVRDDYEFKDKCYSLNVFRKKYPNFLEKFAKQRESLKRYNEQASMIGDFYNPISPIILTINYGNFDFKDVKIRLVYALHYLNINECSIQPQKRWMSKSE